MEADTSGWSGEGDFTARLLDALRAVDEVMFVKVEDAPASRSDAAFSFISNELYVRFASEEQVVRSRRLWVLPAARVIHTKLMTIEALEACLSALPDIGPPDYADEGMLQYLRAERVIPPYQTRGYKLVELVRIYEFGTVPRRDT